MTAPRIVHEPVVAFETYGKWDLTFIRDFFPEIRDAIDANWSVDPCEGMTDEERANWIMGVES